MDQRFSTTFVRLQRFGGLLLLLAVVALPLALLPLPLAVLLVAATIGGVLALIDPIWAVCWAILSVPVQELVQLPGGLTATQATLLLATGSWLLQTLGRPQRFVRWGPLGLPLAGVLAAMVLATALTPYSAVEGAKETLRWIWVTLVYLIVVNCATDRRRMALVIACLLLGPTVEALYGLWQFVTGSGPPSFQVAGGRFVRAYGTIGQPNSFAGYMNMAWPLAVALGASVLRRETGDTSQADPEGALRFRGSLAHGLLSSSSTHSAARVARLMSLACCLASALLLAALGASFSRGGWVGAAGGVAVLAVVWLLFGNNQAARVAVQGRIVVGVCVGFVLVLLIMLLNNAGMLPASVASRLDSIFTNLRLFDVRTVDVTPTNFAVVERMAHLQAAWQMFTTYPLLGVGPGNFSTAYPDFAIPPWLISQGHAHNYYLHSAAEGGMVGALAYLLLLVAVARLCLRTLRRATHSWDRLIVAGGCGMMGAVVVHNLFENLHVLNLPIHIGAVWGLLTVIYGESKT